MCLVSVFLFSLRECMDLKLSALPMLLESSVELNVKPLEMQWLPVTFWPWMSLVALGASV